MGSAPAPSPAARDWEQLGGLPLLSSLSGVAFFFGGGMCGTGISWHGKKSAPGWDQRSAGSRRDSKNWLREGFSFPPSPVFFSLSLSLSSFPLPARAGGGRKGKGKRNPEGNEEQLRRCRPGRVWRRRVRPRRPSLFPKSPQFGSQILGYPEAGRSVVNRGGVRGEAPRPSPSSRKWENPLWKNNSGNGPENSSPGQVSGRAAPL